MCSYKQQAVVTGEDTAQLALNEYVSTQTTHACPLSPTHKNNLAF